MNDEIRMTKSNKNNDDKHKWEEKSYDLEEGPVAFGEAIGEATVARSQRASLEDIPWLGCRVRISCFVIHSCLGILSLDTCENTLR
jgi:hypothetical protein